MMQENDIKKLVAQVIAEMMAKTDPKPPTHAQAEAPIPEEGVLEDITATPLQEQFFVPCPANREGYLAMKTHTPTRLGVWRAGPRNNTMSLLRFRADHATAQDSVFTDVSPDFIAQNGFVAGQTRCNDRDQFVTRPDYGRLLNEETRALYQSRLAGNNKVVIMVGDGLSSAAIEANVVDIIPAIRQGLQAQGIQVGEIPFVKYCRVGAMDDLGQLLDADVVCCLIGERPGLVTSESMSAYIAYRPTVGMAESKRTVVSNIHRGGTPAVEAGAHIADLIGTILEKKMSGIDLNL